MTPLDGKTLSRFVSLAGDRLKGDWVVIGGTVLPLLGVEHRVTVDIEVAGPADAGMSETLALCEIAEELGLPVEAINQAGVFFLRRVRGWEDHLVEIHRGRRATIFVPDATLFVLLKLGRMTEADLSDCLAMLDLARRRDDPVDTARIRREVRKALRGKGPPARAGRLRDLLDEIGDR